MLPSPTPQRGLPWFRHSKARVKSCKGPSRLEKKGCGHGTWGMLEAGGWARPVAQACRRLQSSVGCRGARGLWGLGWYWEMTTCVYIRRAVGLCRSLGGVYCLGSGDLSDYSEAQSWICCCRKTLVFTHRRNPLHLGYSFYLAPHASP